MKALMLISAFLLGLTMTANAEMARFLYHDQDALQTRADIIQQAKHELLVEYYIVTDDDISTGAIALLCEASKRGVKVKVLLDGIASQVKESTMAAVYKDCKDKDKNLNIEFRLFNPFDISTISDVLSRDHDKMLTADGKVMIIGGRNVDKKYFGLDSERNFIDLDIVIGAGNAVDRARTHYLELWDKADSVKKVSLKNFDFEKIKNGCNNVADHYYCQTLLKKEIRASRIDLNLSRARLKSITETMKEGKGNIVYNSGNNVFKGAKNVNGLTLLASSTKENIGLNNKKMSDDLYLLFSKAERKVLILTPYLILNKKAKAMFTDLIQRGVEVTIITNSLKSTDGLAAQAGYSYSKKDIIKMGIELYEYNLEHTAHAKTAVIDDEIVLIGTYNLDPRSSQINREIGIAIKDTSGSGIAAELTSIINKFKADSLLVGKDKQLMNTNLQDAEVSTFKKIKTKVLEYAVPLFEHQL